MSKREMLINYVPGEECRIAIVEDGRLEEFYQERASTESHVGNIYKGRVTNVEPAIQAAFVDFGLGRNGFLHITDVHPKYFPGSAKEETERVGMKTPRRERPLIQHCLKRGQEVLVQVLKEGIGTKGPTLSSYLAIPGRFLVMMLDMERLGVSRKIEDDAERHRIRKILDELEPPEGFGFIGRSAATGCTKAELKRDMAYLTRLWRAIERRRKSLRNVGELYTESDLIIRTIRDIYSSDVERVIVDNEGAARRARDFLGIASPRAGSSVYLYDDGIPLFHRYAIEEQIEHISARTVPLKSGGSLVIDQTEAVVAIDVNSGRMRDAGDAETTAYRTNLEACDEICRQLRLRDLGGVVINDLIDMRDSKHRRKIEGRFRDNLKNDRARTRVLPISQFGILEMTRQRMRPSLRAATAIDCPGCMGRGSVRSAESVVLDVMRRLAVVMHHPSVHTVELTVSPDVAFVLLNKKRAQLVSLEVRFVRQVLVRVNAGGGIDRISLVGRDERGGMVDTSNLDAPTDSALKKVDAGTSDGDGIVAEEDEKEGAGDEWLNKLEAAEQELDPSRGASMAAVAEEDENEAGEDQGERSDSGGRSDSGERGGEGEAGGRKKRRRRRRKGRGGDGDESQQESRGGEGRGDSQPQRQPQKQEDRDDRGGRGDQDRSDEQRKDDSDDQQGRQDQPSQRGGEQGGRDDEEEGGGRRRRRRRRGGRGRRRRGGDRDEQGQPSQSGQSNQSGQQGDRDQDDDRDRDDDRGSDGSWRGADDDEDQTSGSDDRDTNGDRDTDEEADGDDDRGDDSATRQRSRDQQSNQRDQRSRDEQDADAQAESASEGEPTSEGDRASQAEAQKSDSGAEREQKAASAGSSSGYTRDPNLVKAKLADVIEEDFSSGPGNVKEREESEDDEQDQSKGKRPKRGGRKRSRSRSKDEAPQKTAAKKAGDDDADAGKDAAADASRDDAPDADKPEQAAKPKRTRKKSTRKKTSSKSGESASEGGKDDVTSAPESGDKDAGSIKTGDQPKDRDKPDDASKKSDQKGESEKESKEARARRTRPGKAPVSPAAAAAATGGSRPAKVKPQPGRARRNRPSTAKDAGSDAKQDDSPAGDSQADND